MVVNWKTSEANKRLLAAVVASMLPGKPNYNLIAKYYGQGATYNAVEGQFRSIRKIAEKLVKEADGSTSDTTEEAPVKAVKRTVDGEKKAAPATQGVISGRISKSKSKSITPKAARKQLRTEDYVKMEGFDSGYDTHTDPLQATDEDAAYDELSPSNQIFGLEDFPEDDLNLYSTL